MNRSADNPVWKRNEPDSPCLGICVQHPTAGICIGCFRTSAEVANWAHFTQEERQRIRAELPSREPILYTAGTRPSRRRKRRKLQSDRPNTSS